MIELLLVAGIGGAALFFMVRHLKRSFKEGDSCGCCSTEKKDGCSSAKKRKKC